MLFTTPTTCDSTRGEDYDEADDDNYSSGSSAWDDKSCLAERLEQLLLPLAAAAVSVTSNEEEEKEKYPLPLLWMGIKLKRLGLLFQ